MEQEIFALTIALGGVVFAIAVHLFLKKYKPEISDKDNDSKIEESISIPPQKQIYKLSLGFWQGVKFGAGFTVGFFVVMTILAILSAMMVGISIISLVGTMGSWTTVVSGGI